MVKKLEKFYPYLLSFFLLAGVGILAASYCAENYPGFVEIPSVSVVGLVVLALGFAFVLRTWRWWSLGFCGVLALLFFVGFSGLDKIEHFVGWFIGVPSETAYPWVLYTVLLLGALLLLAGILLVYLMKIPLTSGVFGALVFGALLYWDVRGTEWPKSGIAFLMVYVLVSVVERLQRRQEKRPERENQKVVVSLAPFFLVFFLVLLAAPAKTEAYRWGFLTNLVDGAKNLVKQVEIRLEYYLEGEGLFSLSFAGSGSSGQVGGAIADRGRDYLTVRPRTTARTSFYLVGSVWDSFEDGEWHLSEADTGAGDCSEQELDYLEMMYAVYRKDPEGVGDYVKEVSGSVTYEDIYTKTLFYLPKYRKLSAGGAFSWEGASASFEKPKGTDTLVQFSYLQMNLGSEKFDELIEEMALVPYEQRDEEAIALMKEGSWRTPEDLPELLAEREEKIREAYGQVPQLTKEVADWLEKVTKHGETGYEKLKLLEEYLGTYTYTTNPQAITGDFLTGFLCETKEGYCTYFATAFVELARYLGYPARYVQGFVAGQDSGSTKSITVCAGDSHAWAEVYLHGVGWIPFEPVPGYASWRYMPWSVQTSGNAGSNPYEEDYHKPEELPEEILPEEQPLPEKEKKPVAWVILRMLAGAGAVGVCLWLLYGVLNRRIAGRPEKERYYLYWKRIFYLLAVMGMRREAYDTMEDFRIRLRNTGDFEEILPDERFRSFNAVRYGGETPKERELKELQEAAEKLYEEYKKTHPAARSFLVHMHMILKISG